MTGNNDYFYISVISIILFAILFSPTALLQQVLLRTGLVQTAKEARKEDSGHVSDDEDVKVVNEEEELQDINEVRTIKTLN